MDLRDLKAHRATLRLVALAILLVGVTIVIMVMTMR